MSNQKEKRGQVRKQIKDYFENMDTLLENNTLASKTVKSNESKTDRREKEKSKYEFPILVNSAEFNKLTKADKNRILKEDEKIREETEKWWKENAEVQPELSHKFDI